MELKGLEPLTDKKAYKLLSSFTKEQLTTYKQYCIVYLNHKLIQHRFDPNFKTMLHIANERLKILETVEKRMEQDADYKPN